MKVRLRIQIIDDDGKPAGEIDAEGTWSEPSARILRPEFAAGAPDDVIHDTENPGPQRSQAV